MSIIVHTGISVRYTNIYFMVDSQFIEPVCDTKSGKSVDRII